MKLLSHGHVVAATVLYVRHVRQHVHRTLPLHPHLLLQHVWLMAAGPPLQEPVPEVSLKSLFFDKRSRHGVANKGCMSVFVFDMQLTKVGVALLAVKFALRKVLDKAVVAPLHAMHCLHLIKNLCCLPTTKAYMPLPPCFSPQNAHPHQMFPPDPTLNGNLGVRVLWREKHARVCAQMGQYLREQHHQ
jgi:hypothetical protein